MAYLDIDRLEKQVDELIACCRRLQQENQILLARQESLAAERAELIEKNEQARQRIETALARLRTMEDTL
ncbi:TIGR02449 family protein [Thioalkalicoccus limnaeus]|uniref:TIGR02449 family protein n=1 Tax=Thioalkalicoccus limnaeus TaxID=120681 RepID=A0ABV4BDD2_9GAMM